MEVMIAILSFDIQATQIKLYSQPQATINGLHTVFWRMRGDEWLKNGLISWTDCFCDTDTETKWKTICFSTLASDFILPILQPNTGCFPIQTSSPKGNNRSPESNVPRSIWLKILCNLSPTPMMLHIKFDQDWPTGFRDIQVQKCEIFVTQGQVTPKWVVWFSPNSNCTEL